MKKISLFKNPVITGVVYTVIGGIILKIIDVIIGTHIISSIWEMLIYQLSIRIWIVFLFIIILLYMIIKVIKSKSHNAIKADPKKAKIITRVKSYTTDIFDGIRYRWQNIYEDDTYYIEHITAHCPNCDCMLLNQKCPNCKDGKTYTLKTIPELDILIRYRVEQKLKSGEI